jgi:autotransporter-associated beta strand protein
MPRPTSQPLLHPTNPRAVRGGPARLRPLLLATSALACVVLAPAARAADRTWDPTDGNFTNTNNWLLGQAPIAGDTAIFGASSQRNVTIDTAGRSLELTALQLNTGSGDYAFTLTAGSRLGFSGPSRGAVGILTQAGGGSATFNLLDNSVLGFLGAGTAGNATINNQVSSGVLFLESSTADHANINGGQIAFEDKSTAANATIEGKTLTFIVQSTAGNATITTAAGSTASFENSSTAGNATITNHGTLGFFDNSTAGNATIKNHSFDVNGGVRFEGSSTADHANINDGTITFLGKSTAANATIGPANVQFLEQSTAGNATITTAGSFVSFAGNSTAGNATITNHGTLEVSGNATAGNASITSDGAISINQQGSGGAAGLAMTSGRLDISALNSKVTGTTLGSLEGSGTVFLGSKTLTVGGNGGSTRFSGVIDDQGAGGSLSKAGAGTFALTGLNTYAGATSVDGGALVVDGSIAASSGVSVNAGAVLAGTGTVASTQVNDGGTLVAGHNDGTFGTLTVQGNLVFTSAAAYLVQVSPQQAGLTSVTGTATLGGATVSAVFAPGSYVAKQYVILTAAGGLNGSAFGQLVNTNLPANFTTSLSYGSNDVTLNLQMVAPGGSGSQGSPPRLNVNQQNVASGLVNSFNTMGGIPLVFATLTPAGLTQVSGESAVGAQQTTFDAMKQFISVLLDPTAGGRSGAVADAYASMPRKAPAAGDTFDARWNVWVAGYGGSQATDGNAATGSSKTSSTVAGSAVGAEYRLRPDTVAGFALGGGATGFRVSGAGSGSSDLFQAGAYLRHTQGAAFLNAALAYGWQDVTTNRTVTVAGIENLRGRFNANAVSGRLEGGYRYATPVADFKPYAAGQFVSYLTPAFAEQATSGAGPFALSYGSKNVTTARTELGVKTERALAWMDSALMLRGRLAWAHDYDTSRQLQAVFQTLPGSAFVVNGAQPAADAALASVSAELAWRNGWSARATFDSELSGTTQSYAATGLVRYTW